MEKEIEMQIFGDSFFSGECYAREPVEHKFLFFKRKWRPLHEPQVDYAFYDLIWWTVLASCKHCGIEHRFFGLNDADMARAFHLKEIPPKNHNWYTLDELKKYQADSSENV